jgi:hypothetical protein
MNRMFRLSILIFLITSPEVFSIQSQQLDYYGVVSESTDINMIKMAQDLFFSQLKSIEHLSVTDFRTGTVATNVEHLSFSETTTGHLIFFAEIIAQEKKDGSIPPVTWKCIYHLMNSSRTVSISATENYDSYYKILISGKAMIQSLLNQLETPENQIPPAGPQPTESDGALNTELLAGTWTGEPDIDKIILLRGGRGFIIFKNGASMTVLLSITSESGKPSIEVRQTGKPNASFYPSLPRDAALAAAASAEPITWTLHQSGTDTLTGIKSTLILIPDTSGTVTKGTETVVWKKNGAK